MTEEGNEETSIRASFPRLLSEPQKASNMLLRTAAVYCVCVCLRVYDIIKMKLLWWAKLCFCLPYAGILLMLAQNPFTHSAFTVTAEAGYVRGPLMLAFYGIAMLYGIVGLIYCIYCRRYFSVSKWAALFSVYVLAHLAVVIQYFHPELLVEMFSTAVGEMLILLSVMRPEERMDIEVEMLSWAAYQADLEKTAYYRNSGIERRGRTVR